MNKVKSEDIRGKVIILKTKKKLLYLKRLLLDYLISF